MLEEKEEKKPEAIEEKQVEVIQSAQIAQIVEESAEAKQKKQESDERMVAYEQLSDYHKVIYPWQQHTSPEFNKYYYFNPLTQESLWELSAGSETTSRTGAT